MNRVDLTEKEWDAQLFAAKSGLAPMLGWKLCYHTLRSKGSTSGFPDRICVRERLIAVELKSEVGKVSDAQREWLDALANAGVETYLWRPGDLDEIARILGTRWQHGISDNDLTAVRFLWQHGQKPWQPRSLWITGVGRADTQQEFA